MSPSSKGKGKGNGSASDERFSVWKKYILTGCRDQSQTLIDDDEAFIDYSHKGSEKGPTEKDKGWQYGAFDLVSQSKPKAFYEYYQIWISVNICMAPQPNFCKCSGEGGKCGDVDHLCGDGLDVLISLQMGCEPHFMRFLCCVHLVRIDTRHLQSPH